MTTVDISQQSLDMMLRALKLPSFHSCHEEVAIRSERQGWSFGQYLHSLCELELSERERRRIERFSKGSHLPPDKTLERFQMDKVPVKVKRQVPTLCECFRNFQSYEHNVIGGTIFGRLGTA